jgi:polar amino acid transport system permease protein
MFMQSLFRPANLLQFTGFILLVSLAGFGLYSGAESLGYNWQWFRIPRYLVSTGAGDMTFGPLLQGLLVTLEITICSLFLSLFFGLVTALMRLSNSVVGQMIANVYLETIRNTPLLVQIFVVYFVLAPIIDIGRFSSAVLALSLFEGAYASEIIRAGILAVPKGQWEAARALGIGQAHCYRHIVLPQAIRKMLPPLTSQSISLVKDSALVSTIAIFDLTMRGQQIVAETFLTFEIWITVALIYLIVTAAMSGLVRLLEWRLVDLNP